MHEQFVTDEKLREMMHPYNTQCNESLNMRLVELAPKHKNFSRTKSLNYRVSMVVGHHNVGMHQFYRRVFELLKLNLDPALEDWLVSKQKHKEWKQIHDKKPEQKRVRKYKREAKEQKELFEEETAGPKSGTHQAGIAMDGIATPKEGKAGRRKTKRKLVPCNCGGKIKHFRRSSQHCKYGEKGESS